MAFGLRSIGVGPDGVAVRAAGVKVRTVPWDRVEDVIVAPGPTRWSKPRLVAVAPDSTGVDLGSTKDPAAVVRDVRWRRPPAGYQAEAPAPALATIGIDQPGTIDVWPWHVEGALQAAQVSAFGALAVALFAANPWAGGISLVVVLCMLPVALVVRWGPGYLHADPRTLVVLARRRRLEVPMVDVRRIVVVGASAGSQPAWVAVERAGGVDRAWLPRGLDSEAQRALAARLVTMRTWAFTHRAELPRAEELARPGGLVDDRFHLPVSSPTGRRLVPVALAVVAVAAAAGAVAGFVVADRTADAVAARGVRTTGSLVAVDLHAPRSHPRGIVRYDTADGPRETAWSLGPDDGPGVPIPLAYDPEDPSDVWTAGGTTPGRPRVRQPAWAWLALLGTAVAGGATYLVWRRWHPPALVPADGRAVSR